MTTATVAPSPPEEERKDPPPRKATSVEISEAIRRELEGKTEDGHELGYN